MNLNDISLATLAHADGTPMTACFTGPRPADLHGYRDPNLYLPIVDVTEALLHRAAVQGVRTFISGGAQGFDQLAFWAVERVKLAMPGAGVRNIMYAPFPGQARIWSPTGTFSQAEYLLAKQRADDVVFVSDDPPAGDRIAAAKRMHARNHAMARDSDFVIALLSGRSLDWEHSAGGTSECVRNARKTGKPVLAMAYRPAEREPFSFEWLA